MGRILDWHSAVDQGDLIRQAVETLAGGGIVCFPTEMTYIITASVMHYAAVQKVSKLGERPLTVAVSGVADALDWSPNLSEVGRRLARRCWPGLVTLICEGAHEGVAAQLPEEARDLLIDGNSVRLGSPAHQAIQSVMRVLHGQIAFSEALHKEQQPAPQAGHVPEAWSAAADLVLDDGPSSIRQPSTIVRLRGESWTVVRPGTVSEQQLRSLAAFLIVFVCTGNTCRSPLAEALCKKLLAEQLDCTTAELAEHGFLVVSAGLAAIIGGGAAPEAIQVAQEFGADLSGHRTRPLVREIADMADCLITMTQVHLLTIASQYYEAAGACRLLRTDALDVPDPIGCEMEVYRHCAAEIQEQLRPLVSAWIQQRSGE
jgi:protein-tyrosine phosphatase